jgi:hypothetical protein
LLFTSSTNSPEVRHGLYGPSLIGLNTEHHQGKLGYGDPRLPEEFDFVYPLSPVHNVLTDKVLPATLLMINAGKQSFQADIRQYLTLGCPQVTTVLSQCIRSSSSQLFNTNCL